MEHWWKDTNRRKPNTGRENFRGHFV